MITMTTPTSRVLDRARIAVGAYARLTTPAANAARTQGTGVFSPMDAPTCIEHNGTTTRHFETRST